MVAPGTESASRPRVNLSSLLEPSLQALKVLDQDAVLTHVCGWLSIERASPYAFQRMSNKALLFRSLSYRITISRPLYKNVILFTCNLRIKRIQALRDGSFDAGFSTSENFVFKCPSEDNQIVFLTRISPLVIEIAKTQVPIGSLIFHYIIDCLM